MDVLNVKSIKPGIENGNYIEVEIYQTIWSNGDKLWYIDGKLHKDGDQPAIIWASGDKAWCKHGILLTSSDVQQ